MESGGRSVPVVLDFYMPPYEYVLTRICELRHIRPAMLDTFRALAEPNRFQIVALLLEGPRPVGDMVGRLHLRQPQVSKHLRVLSDAGLVDMRVDAQRRIYALRPAALQELQEWVERYRRIWETNYQRLDALLDKLKRDEQPDAAIETGELKTRPKKRIRAKR
jgi:DNA-binding transcriptional ArsR family regulator